MNAPEEKDPAWDLLLKARKIEPSPMFSRNVIRAIRNLEADGAEARVSWLERLKALFVQPRVAIPVAVAAAVAILVTVQGIKPDSAPSPAEIAEQQPEVPAQAQTQPEQEFVAVDPADRARLDEVTSYYYLGELMAVTDPSMLDDSALQRLLD